MGKKMRHTKMTDITIYIHRERKEKKIHQYNINI